ncbi:hypothetical protein [Aquimarina sp. AU474]|uniref:hypothetical protein n=1 Tax=Aquimarina sp. AU474 TaxID=2108529 RepID=UPI00135CCC26|nr:hypothetical protein [Aquimarina sp. AU474]
MWHTSCKLAAAGAKLIINVDEYLNNVIYKDYNSKSSNSKLSYHREEVNSG